MLHRALTGAGFAALVLAVGAPSASAAPGGLAGYRIKATPTNLKKLAEAGFDANEGRSKDGKTIDVAGTEAQLRGLKVGASRIDSARAVTRATKRAARAGSAATDGATDVPYKVWTKYDAFDEEAFNAGKAEADQIPVKEQYTEQYERAVDENPGLVAKRVTGTTYGGREIVALQVTKGATGADIPGRPAVLYNAMQHAREWLAGETCRRTLDWVLDNYGKTTTSGKEVTALVDSTELWFVCVNNPDGYEFTFVPDSTDPGSLRHRVWRKNLRDNDGNGLITSGDGVDPNRNFANHWGLDDDGSSPDPAGETYRGPSAASEPETKAMEALFKEIHPVFQKNDHTAAELLLYPQGFQQDTETADNEIFKALAGDPFEPGIEGFLPELSAGLYITNGDFTDWAYGSQKTLSYTPEGTASEDPKVSVFEYPDSPQQVEQEFRRHLPFVRDLAKTAADPTQVKSHLGNAARPIVVDEFPVSYGDPQPVQASLQRKLGAAELRFRVNGGPAQKVPTAEWNGGKRYYKDDAVYYHRVRGVISGTQPGDKVEAWFVAGGVESAHFTYAAQVESDKPVLLLSNEDWSGKQPNAAALAGPKYLATYKDLLDKAGIPYDVYDVDAQGRTAPDELGVLSHYSHVVWYTGEDYVTRAPDAPGGSGMDRLAVDVQNRVRDFLNEGGKLFFTGQAAGREFAEGYTYNPFQKEEREYCNTSEQCITSQDDFLQYWLGANKYITGPGQDEDGKVYPVAGATAPFKPGPYTLNQLNPALDPATFLVTSSVYDPVKYPQWIGSKKALDYRRPGGSPFEPHTGSWFVSAGAVDQSYRRLTRTVDLTGKADGELSFWTSFDLEPNYDFVFVEAHTVGADDWTTLPDKNGLTSTSTGSSCEAGTAAGSNWQADHPFLAHYQTVKADGTCDPKGTTGEWNAQTGNSGGFKNWKVPLTKFAGKQVEISITVASDPAIQGLGSWVDDATITADGAQVATTSFETDLGGWTAAGPPPGTALTTPRWMRAQGAPFVESPGVTTPDTFYTGFGLEQVDGTTNQVALLSDVFTHLGTPKKPAIAAVTPTLVDPPAPAVVPPAKALGVKFLRLDRQTLRTARSRGVQVSTSCSPVCKVTIELRIARATANRLKLRSIIVGRRTVNLGGTVDSARVRFSKTALSAPAQAGDAAGHGDRHDDGRRAAEAPDRGEPPEVAAEAGRAGRRGAPRWGPSSFAG